MPLALDDFGVDFAASSAWTTDDADTAFRDALRHKNRAQWVLGDLFGADAVSADVLDASSVSLKTIQNYRTTCRAFPRSVRLIPLSFSHYDAAAHLADANLSAALEVLRAAYEGALDRDWVRDECARRLGTYVETAELLLVYNALNGIFLPSGVPDWLPDGYSFSRVVRAPKAP